MEYRLVPFIDQHYQIQYRLKNTKNKFQNITLHNWESMEIRQG